MALEAVRLRPNEEVINHWNGMAWADDAPPGGGLIVLTNLRLVVLGAKGVFKKTYFTVVDRGLETLAEPTVKGGGPEYVLIVAGQSVWFSGTAAQAARDEIAQLRSMKLAQLGQGPPGTHATREVITREIVRVPCRYCGQLMNQTDTRCPSCSAPVTR